MLDVLHESLNISLEYQCRTSCVDNPYNEQENQDAQDIQNMRPVQDVRLHFLIFRLNS